MLKPNLILGTDSTLGRALYNYYLRRDILCLGTSRDRSKASNDVLYLDYEQYEEFSLDGEFNNIIFCAALTNIKKCQTQPKLSKLINVDAQIYLADKLSSKCDKLIFISSNAVFSGDSPFSHIDQKKEPKTIYGSHKSLVEDYMLNNISNSYILRITKVLHDELPLLENWIKAINANQQIEAFHDMTISPIHLNYLVNSFNTIFTNPRDRIIHLSGATDISYYQFACELSRMLAKPVSNIQAVSCKTLGIDKDSVPNYSSLDCSMTQQHYAITAPSVSTSLMQCMHSSEYV